MHNNDAAATINPDTTRRTRILTIPPYYLVIKITDLVFILDSYLLCEKFAGRKSPKSNR
jgi:hypothetical protein